MGWTINQLDALTAADRRDFQKRKDDLKPYLDPASGDDIRALLEQFFAGYPALRFMDEDAANLMLDVYEAALKGLPLWTVDAALKALTFQGATPLHPPTHSEMARAARTALQPFAEESAALDKVLAARVVTPALSDEERVAIHDRIMSGFKLTGRTPGEEEEEKARLERERQEHLRASRSMIARMNAAAGITDGLPHSPLLRRKLVEMGANFGGGKSGVESGGLHPGGDRTLEP